MWSYVNVCVLLLYHIIPILFLISYIEYNVWPEVAKQPIAKHCLPGSIPLQNRSCEVCFPRFHPSEIIITVSYFYDIRDQLSGRTRRPIGRQFERFRDNVQFMLYILLLLLYFVPCNFLVIKLLKSLACEL